MTANLTGPIISVAMNILKTSPAILLALTLPFAPVANADPSSDSNLKFENAWIAEAPPVSKVQAAYMEIENESSDEIKIVAASSDDFGNIEFHRTIDKDGMASMQRQNELVIPADGELKLQPGGYHMMLFRPAKALRAGDKSTFRFTLANGKNIDVVATVKKAAMSESHDHHHNH